MYSLRVQFLIHKISRQQVVTSSRFRVLDPLNDSIRSKFSLSNENFPHSPDHLQLYGSK